MSDLTARERLLERILRLPESVLPQVEQFITQFELSGVCQTTSNTAQDKCAEPKLYVGPRHWPHAPLHRLSDHGTYLVTAGTLRKEHLFRGADRLDLLESTLLKKSKECGWQVEAWAVFSNHYHFVAHASSGCDD